MVKKLLEKSPLKYPLVQHLVIMDPRFLIIKTNKPMLEEKMSRVLDLLTKANQVKPEACDSIISQFQKFLNIVQDFKSEFEAFDVSTDRLDTLLCKVLAGDKSFTDLWSVFGLLLLLSHGQASVERGFSINKEAVTDKMMETMIAKRLIVM